ncbi:hypothetical protein BGZ83_001712 [Gryganskiella cystojenkinii]|nr:hypothetical protein BGZ83_001712 [Gryganskiella cystojenkinii]
MQRSFLLPTGGASTPLQEQESNRIGQRKSVNTAQELHSFFRNPSSHSQHQPQNNSTSSATTLRSMGPPLPLKGPLLQRRQSLKRKLDDINPESESWGQMSSSSTHHQHHHHYSQSLSDRRKTTAVSQLSRQIRFHPNLGNNNNNAFSVPLSQYSVPSSQSQSQSQKAVTTTTYQSQKRLIPTLSDTIPNNNRKSSDFAKALVLPRRHTVTPAITVKSRKKDKYTPPLLSGGYAERLSNLITYEKSEYTMWANATMRQDKIFGSTEPLATVRITQISRDHGLQWCRCKVVCSENNRPPFDVKPRPSDREETINLDTTQRSVAAMPPTNPHPASIRIPSESPEPKLVRVANDGDTSMNQDDSIYDLHRDMHKLYVLSSSQGSIFGRPDDGLMSQCLVQPAQNTLALERQHQVVRPIRYLKSSQGSEDGEEEEEDDMTNMVQQSPPPTDSQSLLRVGQGSSGQDTKNEAEEIINVDDDHRDAVIPEVRIEVTRVENAISSINDRSSDCATLTQQDMMSRTDSVVSSIDDRSSDCGSPNQIAAAVVETIELPHSTGADEASLQESEVSYTIIFSNLFNWSALKVLDLVEIHEPCRRLSLEQGDHNTSIGQVPLWVVERYRVV